MRIWQRRAHPWIWLLVIAVVLAVLVVLVQHEPFLLTPK